MGWAVGFDRHWNRDIGYGVPATCDYPGCGAYIDRGLSFVCGGELYGGERGCGLFFCDGHLLWLLDPRPSVQFCERCVNGEPPFQATPDIREWVEWKLSDESWAQWRDENPGEVSALKASVS